MREWSRCIPFRRRCRRLPNGRCSKRLPLLIGEPDNIKRDPLSLLRMGASFVVCFLLSVPALAQGRKPVKAASGLIGFYARFVQSMNPRLAFAQCRIYAQDIVGNP